MVKCTQRMQDYLDELTIKSNNGDKTSQGILYFKLCFDLTYYGEDFCHKFRKTNLLLDGMCYYKAYGSDIPWNNHHKSFEIFKHVAESDNQIKSYAWVMIGLYYQDSIGVIRNMNQTRTYFEKAAREDNVYALYYLAMLNLDNQHDLSLKYLERAAYQYHCRSIAKLRRQYFVGRYYPTNSQKIVDCCLKSQVRVNPDLKFITSLLATGNVA